MVDASAEDGNKGAAEQGFDDISEVILDRLWRRCPFRRGLLPQNRAVELLESGTRVDAELVDERPPCVEVHLERLGLAPPSVEGEHQLPPQPLSEGVLRDEALDLADEFSRAPELEVGVDSL